MVSLRKLTITVYYESGTVPWGEFDNFIDEVLQSANNMVEVSWGRREEVP